jgi:hypothetical protein
MDAPAVKREAKEDCLFSASAEQLLIQHGRLLGGNAHVVHHHLQCGFARAVTSGSHMIS